MPFTSLDTWGSSKTGCSTGNARPTTQPRGARRRKPGPSWGATGRPYSSGPDKGNGRGSFNSLQDLEASYKKSFEPRARDVLEEIRSEAAFSRRERLRPRRRRPAAPIASATV